MTQAFNLSQLANKVNTSGQLDIATGVSGTLSKSNGGTGQTSYTDGQLLIGNTTGNTLTKATLTAGSGIAVTNGAGSITIASTGGGGFTNMQVFTGSGTWTNPGTVTRVKVTVIGGGGAGGIATWPNPYFSGGAGGGTAIETLTIPTAPVPVTVGAGGSAQVLGGLPGSWTLANSGGTSSFGAYCSATGGGGGLGTGATPPIPSPTLPGFFKQAAGGVGSGGTININGGSTITVDHAPSGSSSLGGGTSWFNYPGASPTAPQTPATWADATVYGAGGGTASSPGSSPIWRSGAGKSGVVIVEY